MRYSAWANQLLYAALERIEPSELSKPRPGRSKGMLGVLGHNTIVDAIWQANVQGLAHGFTSRGLVEAMTLAQLQAAQHSLDDWYVAYALQQDEALLAQEISFTYVSGKSAIMQRGDMLLHTVNHKTYHRGYVADMIYEAGGKPPSMDLNVFLTQ